MASNLPLSSITGTLEALARRYPAPLIEDQLKHIPRIASHIELVKELVPSENPVIADIGGGLGLFSPGCAAVGMTVTLVDDFGDLVNKSDMGTSALSLHRELGVTVDSRDVMCDFHLPRNHFDVITCFDSMEHWHASPKTLFHGLIESLRPGGWFVLSGPNCVNLRKRITVPLGFGKWSPMGSWYEEEVFRAHVREPDVDDLRYIAADIGLENIKVFGRNWLGFDRPGMRQFMPAIDAVLRLRPSLCANIYVSGKKP
jgi:2-polyprenyl-3-methyl-5-hydroxy-6-metoxy-1,4-benzoquinol methylase